MNIIGRFKKDKSYRTKVIIILIAMFLLINSNSEKKEAELTDQSICDEANPSTNCCDLLHLSCGITKCMRSTASIVNSEDKALCISNYCDIGYKIESSWAVANIPICYSCVPSGYLASSGSACCESSSTWNEDYVLCKAYPPNVDPSTYQCNDAERGIADMLSELGMDFSSCKTAYTLAIFGGGMLILMLFAMM